MGREREGGRVWGAPGGVFGDPPLPPLAHDLLINMDGQKANGCSLPAALNQNMLSWQCDGQARPMFEGLVCMLTMSMYMTLI